MRSTPGRSPPGRSRPIRRWRSTCPRRCCGASILTLARRWMCATMSGGWRRARCAAGPVECAEAGSRPEMVNWYRRSVLSKEPPRAILITGGSAGIGRAAALLFAAMGDQVAVVARRAEALDELAAEAERAKLPGTILPLVADVTDAAAIQRAVARALAEFNRLDVVVAGAGVGHRGSLADAQWDDLDAVLRTNVDGVLHTVRAAVPAMRASGGGHIVLLSS